MIANHTIKGHNYSYHIRGDRSPLTITTQKYLCINHGDQLTSKDSPRAERVNILVQLL